MTWKEKQIRRAKTEKEAGVLNSPERAILAGLFILLFKQLVSEQVCYFMENRLDKKLDAYIYTIQAIKMNPLKKYRCIKQRDKEAFFSAFPLPPIAHTIVDGALMHYMIIHKKTM